MGIVECAREQDVVDAVAAKRWPGRCGADLQSHVSACAVCADLLEVVAPLLEARDDAHASVRVPASGTVWWRAQVRARREAARQAARPITVVQAVAASLAAAALIAVIVAAGPWLESSIAPFARVFPVRLSDLTLPDISAISGGWWWVAAAVGTWLIVAPIAIYLTGNED